MNLADLFIAKKLAGGGGGGTGTDNYNELSNKPQINSTALTGDKSASDLGLQSEIDSDNKISADYVDDTNTSNKFVSAAEKLEWSGKQDAIDADHKIDADYVDDTTSDNKFVTASDKTAWNAKQNAIDSSHKLSSDLVDDTGHTNLFVTSTEKSTWSGKQDKIDSSHKLSSTLVSFDSSEAAALASGIDSSKVGQISTNQTNILYAIKTGVKNIIVLPDGVYQPSSKTKFTVVDGSVTCETTASYTDAVYISDFVIPAGTYSFTSTENNTGFQVRLYTNGTRIEGNPFTLDVDTEVNIALYSLGSNSSGTLTPMICLKSIYDQDSSYAKPTRQNYDLTRLEAEDRAALVEVVDGGAKNLLDTSTTTVSNVTFTQDSNSYITASPNNADTRPWNYANAQYKLNLKAGTYVFAMDIKTATSNTGIGFNLYSSNGTSIIHSETSEILSKTGMITWQFTITTEGTYGVVYKCFDMVARLMVCTKAAFGVSSKFVPYRPNYDLVVSRTKDNSKLIEDSSNGSVATSVAILNTYRTLIGVLMNSQSSDTTSTTLPAVLMGNGNRMIVTSKDNSAVATIQKVSGNLEYVVPSGYILFLYGIA